MVKTVVESETDVDDWVNTAVGVTEGVRISTPIATFEVFHSISMAPVQPIPYFWMTLLMNFITANTICIAYPRLMFAKYGFFNGCTFTFEEMELQYKYHRRRYTLQNNARFLDLYCCSWHRSSAACPMTRRYFGDPHCCTITFDRMSKPLSTAPDGVMALWLIGGVCEDGYCGNFFVSALVQSAIMVCG